MLQKTVYKSINSLWRYFCFDFHVFAIMLTSAQESLGMLTVTFFGCFSVCFSSVFTANSKNFMAKTDEKRNEKQMKNGYREPLPPRILEKQLKNKIHMCLACRLLFNFAVSWVISTDSASLPCFIPCASRYTLCLANLLVNTGWMG